MNANGAASNATQTTEEYTFTLSLYETKRRFLFFDEWGFYIILLVLYELGVPPLIITFVMGYGAMAIITSYKNIGILERDLNRKLYGSPGRSEKSWFFWPLFRENE